MASEKLTAEWQVDPAMGDDLVMSMRFPDRAALRRFAARLHAPPLLRVTSASGAQAVTTANAILRWRDDEPLPAADGSWAEPPADRGDAVVAVDMLEAFVAWTRSRGLIDEAKARRISRAVQIDLAGAAGGRPA